eukprot:scaffold52123_cov33-Attheya_sp.AAC.1
MTGGLQPGRPHTITGLNPSITCPWNHSRPTTQTGTPRVLTAVSNRATEERSPTGSDPSSTRSHHIC